MEPISIRLPKELIEQAREKAREEGTTLGQKARWLIRQWVKTETPGQVQHIDPHGPDPDRATTLAQGETGA